MSTMPAYPREITLDTLPQLLAAHHARFGDMTMTAGPVETPPVGASQQAPQPGQEPDPAERPDGVSDEEWQALGDPGRTALTRERERAQAAERALAAARAARPAPPKKDDPPKPAEPQEKKATSEPDIAKIVQEAVAAAVKPFAEKDAQREAEKAAEAIADTVLETARDQFHDPTDALASIDLTQVTDGNGRADQDKIDTAIKDLLARKPHLGKAPDGRRHAPPGSPAGASAPAAPLDTRVKETLARMQAQTGIKAT